MKKPRKLFPLVLFLTLFLFACSNENQSTSIEGIDVIASVASNNQSLNEALIQAKITNTTEKVFKGTVTLYGSLLQEHKFWDVELDYLAPGTSVIRELKLSYIALDNPEYTYKADGEFIDAQPESDIAYELFYQPSDSSMYVQTETVTTESATAIVKDLYAKHGESLKHIAIYSKDHDIKEGKQPESLPDAEYYYNVAVKQITINQPDGSVEIIDFEI